MVAVVTGSVMALTIVSAPVAATVRPRLRFGAFVPSSPQSGMVAVHDLEDALGRQLDIVMFYQAWGDDSSPDVDPTWLAEATQGGRDVLLTWEPWVPGGPVDQPGYRLRRIVDGDLDRYIRSWARGLAAYGGPVYLRPMHEMNGNWYPWSGVVNGNSPQLYRSAWRHIHDVFARNGADNVRWVWSPNAADVPVTNRFERYFPGPRYVDVVALDGYNWGTCVPEYGGWQSFDHIFGSAYRRLTELTSKPVWIAETASAPDGGDKSRWVDEMFGSIARRFPKIRAVVWFDSQKECDWRLTSPQQAVAIAGLRLT
jgi:beta-mannanase